MDRLPLDLSLEDSLTMASKSDEFYLTSGQSPPPPVPLEDATNNALKSSSTSSDLDRNIELNKRLFFDSPPSHKNTIKLAASGPSLNELMLMQSPPQQSKSSKRSREMTPDSIDSSLTSSLTIEPNSGQQLPSEPQNSHTVTPNSISLQQLQQLLLLQQQLAATNNSSSNVNIDSNLLTPALLQTLLIQSQMITQHQQKNKSDRGNELDEKMMSLLKIDDSEKMMRDPKVSLEFDDEDVDAGAERNEVSVEDEVSSGAVMPVLADGLSDTEINDDENENDNDRAASDFVYSARRSVDQKASLKNGGCCGRAVVNSYSPSSSSISNSPPSSSKLRASNKICSDDNSAVVGVGNGASACCDDVASRKQHKDSISEREYDTDEETNKLLAEAEQRSSAHIGADVRQSGDMAAAHKRQHKNPRPRESNICSANLFF